jgi:hypothetical protein
MLVYNVEGEDASMVKLLSFLISLGSDTVVHYVAISTQWCLTQAKNGIKVHIKYVAQLSIYTEQKQSIVTTRKQQKKLN